MKLICAKCGKEYTRRDFYEKHIVKCTGLPTKKKISKKKPSISKKNKLNNVKKVGGDFKAEILSLLKNYNTRLTRIEEFLQLTHKNGKKSRFSIDENKGYKQIKKIYSGIQEKIGNLAPVPILYEKLQDFYSYEDSQITELLTTLFITNKIDLQPGTARRGKPIVIDGRPLYWFNILR
uniref:Uncharacterized protein n=1 Tax=Promethearchaeum syntrophicum TaxID=2594042 RepID=A0A5B9DET8_9ARCH|nr:hypothetical protein [Candidatus Prometheoarchaeum syntrophicum]QEE17778.1 hypothetical protein DSAG12_03616 [Candidatus Prometheoarchaeum syntrophicum]